MDLSNIGSLLVGLSSLDSFVVGIACEKCRASPKDVVSVINKMKLRKMNRDEVIGFLLKGDLASASALVSAPITVVNAPKFLNRNEVVKKALTVPAPSTKRASISGKKLSTSPVSSPRKANFDGKDKFSLDNESTLAILGKEENVNNEVVVEKYPCKGCGRSFESSVKLARHIEFSTLCTLPPVSMSIAPKLPAPTINRVDVFHVQDKSLSFFVSGNEELVSMDVQIFEAPVLNVYIIRVHRTDANSEGFGWELLADANVVATLANKKDNESTVILKRIRVSPEGEVYLGKTYDNVEIELSEERREQVIRVLKISMDEFVVEDGESETVEEKLNSLNQSFKSFSKDKQSIEKLLNHVERIGA